MEFFTNLHQFGDIGLLALRVGLAAVFLVHGTAKWAMWKMQPSAQMPSGMISLMKFLSIVEPLGAVAVLFGFLTQLAALGLGIIMIGAIYMKITAWKLPFWSKENKATGWEFDFINLIACIALFFLGAGKYALDPGVFGL